MSPGAWTLLAWVGANVALVPFVLTGRALADWWRGPCVGSRR